MTRLPDVNASFDVFADDLLAERAARPIVIIGASKIDDLLVEILRKYLLPKNAKEKEADELLENDAPLSTFSSRIKMCRRLGLIDRSTCAVLEKLRKLRNLSAHEIKFDHTVSPVREHVSEFRTLIVGRSSYTLTRTRYFESTTLKVIEELQCALLTLCVLLEAIRDSTSTTTGVKKTLSISAR
jgi:DNA-binding MltR family transcriptional regulator